MPPPCTAWPPGRGERLIQAATPDARAERPLEHLCVRRCFPKGEGGLLRSPLVGCARALEGAETLRGFLSLLLLKEGNLEDFPAVLDEVRRLELAARGGAVCTVTCAREPDGPMKEDLQRAVCRLRGLDQVVMRFQVDPELLGWLCLGNSGGHLRLQRQRAG